MLLKPTSRFWSAARIAAYLDAMLKDVHATLDTLAEHFHCPIYVHNTAGTIRSSGMISGIVKKSVSRNSRRQACQIINDDIARYLSNPHPNRASNSLTKMRSAHKKARRNWAGYISKATRFIPLGSVWSWGAGHTSKPSTQTLFLRAKR